MIQALINMRLKQSVTRCFIDEPYHGNQFTGVHDCCTIETDPLSLQESDLGEDGLRDCAQYRNSYQLSPVQLLLAGHYYAPGGQGEVDFVSVQSIHSLHRFGPFIEF